MKKYVQLLLPALFCIYNCGAQNPELWGSTVHGGNTGAGVSFSYSLCNGGYTVRYSFDSLYYSGCCAQGGLLRASDGLLYGITYSCGAYDDGVLYSYSIATDSLIALHYFGNGTDGSQPWFASLTQASNGLLYGMTEYGGTDTFGTIFSYNPANHAYAVVHNFALGDSDGAFPETSNLIQANDSLLYGMTSLGPYGGGTIFSFNINTNQEKVMASCGGDAEGTLCHASNGLYYGVTSGGGGFEEGTLFSFNDVTDSVTTLYLFANSDEGISHPAGQLLQVGDSLLYGITRASLHGYGGSIFSYNIFTDTLIFLHLIDYDPALAEPIGYLTLGPDGRIYINCSGDGTGSNYGGIMRYDPVSNTILTVHAFGGVDGEYPGQRLILINDTIKTCTLSKAYTSHHTICTGDTLYQGSHAYTQPGVYTDTLVHAGCGLCDSIVTLTLAVLTTPPPVYVYDTVCNNQPYFLDGRWLDTTGVYTTHLYSSNYCDSIVILNLMVKPAPQVSFSWDSMFAAGTLTIYGADSTYAEWCATAGQRVPLLGGYPPGGVYSDGGNWVSNNMLVSANVVATDGVTYTWTAPNGCSSFASLNLYITICFDIDEVNAGFNMSLHPNPASDLLYIQTQGIQPQTTSIYNVSGQLVSAAAFTPQVDVSALAPGVYLMEVNATGATARRRFVKM